MEALLGIRGTQKCEMANLGLPVAPGFCVTRQCMSSDSGSEGASLSEGARNDIKLALHELENLTERRFGNLVDPLLLSVQGDLPSSMKGFRGTIANIGLNDATVQAWTRHASPHFVWDSYRRLICNFARAVRKLDMEPFERELREVKNRLNAKDRLGRDHQDCHIPTAELRNLVDMYKEFFEEQTGEPFPQDPEKQLWEAIHAASCSWDPAQGPCSSAVTVQSTVYSNYDFKSAVGFTVLGDSTEDTEDRTEQLHGKWFMNAQSEDMASDRIPQHVTQDASCSWAAQKGIGESERIDEYPSLEEWMPGIFAQLLRWQDIIENHFADVHGVEFAVYQGKLWFLEAFDKQLQQSLQTACADLPDVQVVSVSAEPCTAEQDTSAWPEFGSETEEPSGPELFSDASVEGAADEFQEESELHAQSDASRETDQMFDAPGMEDQVLTQSQALDCMHPRSGDIAKSKAIQLVRTSVTVNLRHVLQRVGNRVRKASSRRRSVQLPRTHPKEAVQEADSRKIGKWLPATPSGLALWQTGLAGGLAAVSCKSLSFFIERVAVESQTRANLGSAISHARAGAMQQGFRGFVMPGGPARVFPFGAVCCTMYTNLCKATPADDMGNSCSALWRAGCAYTAVSTATALTHATAPKEECGQVRGPYGRLYSGKNPLFTRMVPTLAIEMCVIDMVKNSALDRGHEVSAGVLVASGAAAGLVAQTIMHPLKTVTSSASAAGLIASGTNVTSGDALAVVRQGASTMYAGMGQACLRSMPVAAMNSLVRVGLTTLFLKNL